MTAQDLALLADAAALIWLAGLTAYVLFPGKASGVTPREPVAPHVGPQVATRAPSSNDWVRAQLKARIAERQRAQRAERQRAQHRTSGE